MSKSISQRPSQSMYQASLPEPVEAIAFVNGFVARDRIGFLWMWKNLFGIRTDTAKAPGCVQMKAGICGPNEVVMVSYWQSEAHLRDFFRGPAHHRMMQFVRQHPQSLCLYNETYSPARPGKYTHEPQGMALLYKQV